MGTKTATLKAPKAPKSTSAKSASTLRQPQSPPAPAPKVKKPKASAKPKGTTVAVALPPDATPTVDVSDAVPAQLPPLPRVIGINFGTGFTAGHFRGIPEAFIGGGFVYTSRFTVAPGYIEVASPLKKVFGDVARFRAWLAKEDDNDETTVNALADDEIPQIESTLRHLADGIVLHRTPIVMTVPDVLGCESDESESMDARLYVGEQGQRSWFNDGYLAALGDPPTLHKAELPARGFARSDSLASVLRETNARTATIEQRLSAFLFHRPSDATRERASLPAVLTPAMLGVPADAPGEVTVVASVVEEPKKGKNKKK